MSIEETTAKLDAMAARWDRGAATAPAGTHRQSSPADIYRGYAQACRDRAHTLATAVELAGRLECARIDARRGEGPDVVDVATIADTIGPADLVRLTFRLRATLDAETGIGPCERPPIAPAALTDVWDAPVSVWQHPDDGPTHVIAVAVLPRMYLETWHHPVETPRDRFGAEVIARSHSAGRPDVFAVFWRADEPRADWRQVTPEMSGAEATVWDGTPLPINGRRGVDDRMAAWLHALAGTWPGRTAGN